MSNSSAGAGTAALVVGYKLEQMQSQLNKALETYSSEKNVTVAQMEADREARKLEYIEAEQHKRRVAYETELLNLQKNRFDAEQSGLDDQVAHYKKLIEQLEDRGVEKTGFETDAVSQAFSDQLSEIAQTFSDKKISEQKASLKRLDRLNELLEESNATEKDFLRQQINEIKSAASAEHKRKKSVKERAGGLWEKAQGASRLASMYSGLVGHNPIAMAAWKGVEGAIGLARDYTKNRKSVNADESQIRGAEALARKNALKDDIIRTREDEVSLIRAERNELKPAKKKPVSIANQQPIAPVDDLGGDTPLDFGGLFAGLESIDDDDHSGFELDPQQFSPVDLSPSDGGSMEFEPIKIDQDEPLFVRIAQDEPVKVLLDGDNQPGNTESHFERETQVAQDGNRLLVSAEIEQDQPVNVIMRDDTEVVAQKRLEAFEREQTTSQTIDAINTQAESTEKLAHNVDKMSNKNTSLHTKKTEIGGNGFFGRGGFLTSAMVAFSRPFAGIARILAPIGGVLSKGVSALSGGISMLGGMMKMMPGGGMLKGGLSKMAAFAKPAALVAGAGAAGYGIGTLINDHLLSDETKESIGNFLGRGVDNVLAAFGNEDAEKRLKLMDSDQIEVPSPKKSSDAVTKIQTGTDQVNDAKAKQETKVVVAPTTKKVTNVSTTSGATVAPGSMSARNPDSSIQRLTDRFISFSMT